MKNDKCPSCGSKIKPMQRFRAIYGLFALKCPSCGAFYSAMTLFKENKKKYITYNLMIFVLISFFGVAAVSSYYTLDVLIYAVIIFHVVHTVVIFFLVDFKLIKKVRRYERREFLESLCVAFIIICFGGVIIFGRLDGQRLIYDRYDPNYINTRIQSIKLMLQKDQRIVSSHDFFKLKERTSDAGPLLNSLFRWVGGREEYKEYNGKIPYIDDEDLPQNCEWRKQKVDLSKCDMEKYKNIDFTWIDRLSKYDYWDVTSNIPVSEKYDLIYGAPSVKAYGLINLFRIYALRTVVNNEIGNIAKIRKMAQLLYTTNVENNILVAMVLLDFERDLYNYFASNGLADGFKWDVVSQEVMMSAKKYLRVYAHALVPLLSIDLLRLFFFNNHSDAGICFALKKGMHYFKGFYRNVLRNTVFYGSQTVYRDQYQMIDSRNEW